MIYDRFVASRNRKVMTAAATSGAIVSSMFPSQITEKLLSRQTKLDKKKQGNEWKAQSTSREMPRTSEEYGHATIADFYPATSILFADIVGFTAWSSQREPEQVFKLLEAVFAACDEVAQRRRVFKVETVGDW